MSKRDLYLEKAQAKIDEQVARLDQLKARVRGKVADQKIVAHDHLEKLDANLENAKVKLAEVKDAAEDTWEDVAGRLDRLSDDLAASFKKFLG
ncbi:MAG: hypothetical protein ACSHXK_08590 [Oceanococcus sp.]